MVSALAFVVGCQARSERRTYLEHESADELELPSMPAPSPEIPPNFSKADITEDAYQKLKEMQAKGEDPHAMIRGLPHSSTEAPPMGELTPQILASKANLPLQWRTPDSWQEKSAGDMRLAAFGRSDDPGLDISIISLSGNAGGFSANINRWLGQIELPPMDEAKIQSFLGGQQKFKTKDGTPIQVVDLSGLQNSPDSSTPSILAAIVQTPSRTLFVKMSGPYESIQKNRDQFKMLCESLQVKNP